MTDTKPAFILAISGRTNADMDRNRAGEIADAVGEYPAATLLAVSHFSKSRDDIWAVEAHFAETPDVNHLTTFLTDVFGIAVGGLEFTVQDMPDKDWVMESLSGLAPVRAGRFFVYGRHDKDKIPAGAIAIEIDASLAFGTGHHGTTEGCLLALDEVLTARRFTDVLDLGCGTALLAIAAAKALGVAVLASDIDPEAVRVARDNANLNGVGDLVRCEMAAGFDHPVFERNKPFDLILANILAGPLIDMASDLAAHMAPGGIAILSGLLIEQSAQVEASYHANGFRVISRLHRGDWAILTLRAA